MKCRRIWPMAPIVLVLVTLALASCSALTGPPGGYRTPEQGLNAVYPDAAVFQDARVGGDHIYLLKAYKGTTWVLTMAELDRWGTWRLQGGHSAGALDPLGPLTFITRDVGHVESKLGEATSVYPKVKVYAGEVLDPRITWVEIAIPSENIAPVRAEAVSGTWLVYFPWRTGLPPFPNFTIRAGNAEGELFSDTDPWQTSARLKEQEAMPTPPDPQPAAGASCPVPRGWAAVSVKHDEGLGHPTGAFAPEGNAILANGEGNRVVRYSLDREPDPRYVTERPYRYFRLSGDGRLLAGSVDGELWVKDLSSGEERPLGFSGSGVVAWRHEEQAFFFVGEHEGVAALGEFDLEAGTTRWWAHGDPEALYPDPAQGAVLLLGTALFDKPHPEGALTPDGRDLFFSAGHSGTGTVLRLALDTGQVYAYTDTVGDGFSVRLDPGGKVAYFGWGGLYLLEISTRKARLLDAPPGSVLVRDVSQDGMVLILARGDDEGYCWLVGPLATGGMKSPVADSGPV